MLHKDMPKAREQLTADSLQLTASRNDKRRTMSNEREMTREESDATAAIA